MQFMTGSYVDVFVGKLYTRSISTSFH